MTFHGLSFECIVEIVTDKMILSNMIHQETLYGIFVIDANGHKIPYGFKNV